MAVVFDASVLVDLFSKRTGGDRRSRLDHLVAGLAKQRTKVLIPTPAFAEFMVKAGKARDAFLQTIDRSSAFTVESFDRRAAVECALLLAEAWTRTQQANISRSKIKFDWQIVAIAASRKATTIYSDDPDITRAAARVGIPVVPTSALPLPPESAQAKLSFDKPGDPQTDG